ncbi:hypothetical protein NX722_23430 [Endozoicomonas gorgoniicola]|uniref:Uncharacterized protein n=1 Tax=Endozoicomonas gorgoniicola TaxID=1234144 RepID=A0ABT3N1M5_9GAMM|nr:hypothetical protein [Endozoicomonas gorgoniicola]MCW7555519.1 hypothetical protein [Endozoicomonas gorgoniicola]
MKEVVENMFTKKQAIGSLGLLSKALCECQGGLRANEAKAVAKILSEVQLALVDVEAEACLHEKEKEID